MRNITGTAHKGEKKHEKLQKNKETAVIIKNYNIIYGRVKVFKLNHELWFGFTNLCQEQQTTINTGVKETELRYKIHRKYQIMLGIYTAKYRRYKLSDKFYGQLHNI
jgi:uncharacterized protein YfbU (UPF0304 family)